MKTHIMSFYQEQNEDKLFFMYRKMANKLIVMGEPIGDYRFINKAIKYNKIINAIITIVIFKIFFFFKFFFFIVSSPYFF